HSFPLLRGVATKFTATSPFLLSSEANPQNLHCRNPEPPKRAATPLNPPRTSPKFTPTPPTKIRDHQVTDFARSIPSSNSAPDGVERNRAASFANRTPGKSSRYA